VFYMFLNIVLYTLGNYQMSWIVSCVIQEAIMVLWKLVLPLDYCIEQHRSCMRFAIVVFFNVCVIV
jgi:hypothetical protein